MTLTPFFSPSLVFTLAAIAITLSLAGFAMWPAMVVRAPRAILGLLGALTALALSQLVSLAPPEFHLALDPSEEALMVRGDPAREIYEAATQRFGGDDRYVVMIEGGDRFEREALVRLRDLGHALAQLEAIRRVESLINAKDFFYDRDADLIEIGAFVREIPDDEIALRALRDRALSDPIYPQYLVSKDGRGVAIDLALHPMSDRAWIDSGADESIRELTARFLRGGERAYFSGRPHIKAQAYHQMVRDLARLIPLAVLVAALAALVLTRSLRGALLPLAGCLAAALWTGAVMVTTGVPLNLITLVLPSTLIALGGLYGIHLLGRYEIECRAGGTPAEVALRTLRYMRLPVIVAGTTTCVGFASLLLAETRATGELGLFAVFGIASLTLISLVGIPAALALLPIRPPREGGPSAPFSDWIDTVLRGAARLATEHATGVLAIWGLLAVVALALLWRVEVDTDYLTFFDRDAQVRRDFEAIHQRLGGPVPLYVTFTSDDEGTFRRPQTLRTLERIGERLEALPGVDNTLSMVAPIQKLNRAFESGDPAEARIPDTEAEVADLVLLIPKNEMRRFASSNHRAANIVVRTGAIGSSAIRALKEAIVTRLRDEALVPPGTRVAVTGNAIVLNSSADRVASDQWRSVGFASVAILVLMGAVLRSPWLALLAMIPNWLPVLLFFGVLGTGAASLSLPTGLIGCLCLGVAIDDSVHLLVSFHRDRLAGFSTSDAIAGTLLRVGRPIIVTSVMLVAGLVTITVSGFATLREFGALTAMTMLFCLGTDLLLLPALLARARA